MLAVVIGCTFLLFGAFLASVSLWLGCGVAFIGALIGLGAVVLSSEGSL